MATTVAFKSREDHRKPMELEEARRAGLTPAEVDEDGNEINPHIPPYLSSAPWYLNANRPGLKHQRNWKSEPEHTKLWYDRGAKGFQAETCRKGACQNCGSMTHNAKSCTERPRKVGAKWTNKHVAPDEIIESIELNYDGKHDRWNRYDTSRYFLDAKRHEAEDDSRVDDNEQIDFARVVKRARTAVGGSVRNLRIREDTAKYLLNLDVNSAYYDPKTRSMREDPLPNEKSCLGDNRYRNSGQALEFKQLNFHAREAFDKGRDIHLQAVPTRSEFLFKNCKVIGDRLKTRTKDATLEKYGNAASEEEFPRELILLGQSEK